MQYRVTVRYGVMGNVGQFSSPEEKVRKGDDLIVRTDRGVEWAEAVSAAEAVPEEEDKPKFDGEVLRVAEEVDREKQQKIDEEWIPAELDFCREMIAQHKLPMKLVRAEHLFGGNKIIFYFLADGRVDFRRLVKDLARKYQTRIEMRQIGVRDEARLLADYEHCGCELCCRRFIKNLEPVTMKMAKNQKATLDPAKISGRCGRLMCCLRFEDPVYDELKKELPRRGSKVKTPEGTGAVVDSNIMRQEVTVELPDGQRVSTAVAETEVISRKSKQKKDKEKDRSRRRGRRGRNNQGKNQQGGGRRNSSKQAGAEDSKKS